MHHPLLKARARVRRRDAGDTHLDMIVGDPKDKSILHVEDRRQLPKFVDDVGFGDRRWSISVTVLSDTVEA